MAIISLKIYIYIYKSSRIILIQLIQNYINFFILYLNPDFRDFFFGFGFSIILLVF